MDTNLPEPSSTPLVRPFYPALDGMRAIAFLMVFLLHYAGTGVPYLSPIFSWGWMGVDVFFVLSGFLITGILYDSLHNKHFFRDFYVRRALRIFPLFYGVWIIALLLTPLLHIDWNRYNLAQAAYIGNFFAPNAMHPHPLPGAILFSPYHAGGSPRTINVNHFWTLCIEEQFYLIWPAIVWLVRSRQRLLHLCLGLVAVVPIMRLLYFHAHPGPQVELELYGWTFFRMDSLLLGAAIALWLRGPASSAANIRRTASIAALAAPALFVAGYLLTTTHNVVLVTNPFVCTFGYTLIAITGGAILLLSIDPSTWLTRALQRRPLLFLGRLSYGLYVFHLMPVGLFSKAYLRLQPYHLQLAVAPLALAVTVCVAWLSFRFYESPFLRLKSVLAPQPVSRPVATPAFSPSRIPQQRPEHVLLRPTA